MSFISAVSPLELSGQQTKNIDDVRPEAPFLRLNDAAELGRGLWYSVGPGGAQMLGMAAAGALNWAPVTDNYREELQNKVFGMVTDTRNYWRDWYTDSASSTMGGQILRGLGEFGGQLIYGGAAGAFTVGGTEAALGAVDSGKTASEALQLGALKGTVGAVSVALPFKLPVLSGSGALSATAQRLGYGITSNVVPGVAERSTEKALLESWGYDQEAATKNALDPTALAIDAIFGVTLGAGARFLDIRADRKNADLIAEQQVRGEADAINTPASVAAGGDAPTLPTVEQAVPIDVAPAGRAFQEVETRISQRLNEGRERAALPFDRNQARVLDARLESLQYELQKLPNDMPGISKADIASRAAEIRAGDPRINAKAATVKAEQELQARAATELGTRQKARGEITQQIDNVTQQLERYKYAKSAEAELRKIEQDLAKATTPAERMAAAKIDDPALLDQVNREQAADLAQVRANLTQEQMDAALARNLQLKGDDLAIGEPTRATDLGRHRAQLAEMAAAMDEGRTPNVDIVQAGEFKPDPRQGQKLNAVLRDVTKELTAEQKAGLSNGDPIDAPVSGTFKAITTERSKQIADFKAQQEAVYKSMGDDAMMYDENGNKTTVGEFRKQQAEILAKANDEVATVENLVACMIKGL